MYGHLKEAEIPPHVDAENRWIFSNLLLKVDEFIKS